MNAAIDWSQTPKQFLIWAFICCASATPSFYWAMMLHHEPMQIAAVVAGVLMFIIAYTLVGSAHRMRRLRRNNKALRIALRTGYITRLLLSAAYPFGFIADLFVGGYVSTSIVEWLLTGRWNPGGYESTSHQAGFVKILATTLTHGLVLNLALFIYMAVIYSFARTMLPTLPDGLCAHCGYDLRASPSTCPECGTPAAPKAATAALPQYTR